MGEKVQGVRVENRRPSDVFLALWRYHILNERSSSGLEDFAQLADVWQQIRELEAMATGEHPRPIAAADIRQPGLGTRAEQAPPLQCAPDPAETIPERDQQEPVSESDTPEAPPAGMRDGEAIGKAAFATRKRKAMERLDAVLAAGVTRQEVADAARGLTITDVMNILDRKPLPVTVWSKLEKALDALEKRAAPEAPPEGD